ncbi:MAG: hypothetical protein COZ46_01395 [Verrucomicrobia bacterium CG_4_10_14_3_um_filter_43_23]|nr:MAG: hypothetical protein AUJ82_01425 [Verrucomicrobia bacterium CG1_02_43_26]PIP59554.1 MAG: hypothetical protein COX01_03000 [Verrucomicrobia bacterium CG22_combo_CG10-13_8_21_14_all_43_17]PIX58854.1 MAG: hypothetical protein COZ46_01395 [Verrucomicrobia bacterium CG_4_10_14_3_um_filter_43_23]PIY60949.1 MAG: hypothetical protein COY94_08075 [Verrucomicrobia bacterium CG_4_10_14_0_8_um_filter_43_34]PJA44864.1 MAG: hypothetical protein CO175_00885 [Verrucomicrobia bacterium CG_4_9_14_3_um_fi
MKKAWTFLFIAGALEIAGVLLLKAASGFTLLVPSIFFFIATGTSFIFLSLAIRKIPIGTAYAIWTGIGAVGGFVFAIILFGEPANFARILCLILIVTGIVGLKLSAHQKLKEDTNP